MKNMAVQIYTIFDALRYTHLRAERYIIYGLIFILQKEEKERETEKKKEKKQLSF